MAQTEDWEKWRRIKAEKEKAIKDALTLQEDRSNLAFLDAKSFATQKRKLSRNPESYRASGEKLAGISVVLIAVGIIGEKAVLFFMKSIGAANREHFMAENQATLQALGYLYNLFSFMSLVALLLAIGAIASAIWYRRKANKKVLHIFIAAGATIVAFVLNRWLVVLIANMFHS